MAFLRVQLGLPSHKRSCRRTETASSPPCGHQGVSSVGTRVPSKGHSGAISHQSCFLSDFLSLCSPAGDSSHLCSLPMLGTAHLPQEATQPSVPPVPSVLCSALCGKHCFLLRLINTWGLPAPTLATEPQGNSCVFPRTHKMLVSMESWRQHRHF